MPKKIVNAHVLPFKEKPKLVFRVLEQPAPLSMEQQRFILSCREIPRLFDLWLWFKQQGFADVHDSFDDSHQP